MFEFIANLFRFLARISSHVGEILTAPGFKQTSTARRIVTIATLLCIALALLGAYRVVLHWTAVDPQTVIAGERMLYAVNASSRIALAIPAMGLSVFSAWLAFGVLDRTRMGARLLHWAAQDNETTEGAKTRNGGTILAVLILGFCIILAQALR